MGGWRVESWGWRGLLAAVLLGAPAWAEDAPASTEDAAQAEPVEVAAAEVPVTPTVTEPPPAAVPAPAEKPAKPKKPGDKKGDTLGENPDAEDDAGEVPERHLRVFGRVNARASADERDDYARTMKIPKARVGVSGSYSNIAGEVSADLSDKNPLKDAFVRLSDDSRRLRLYAGQFKAPFLERELESSWDLPVVERGLVADYLVDTNQLGGRRFGFMGEVHLKPLWNFKMSGGIFQGATGAGGERLSEDASGRVSVRPIKRLTLGATAYLGEVFEGTRRHAVSGYATFHLHGFQLRGEYVTGRLALGAFDAQLALASYTLAVGPKKQWAVQPMLGGEALRLRGDVGGQGWAALGGFNVLYLDAFKAQFQAERALKPGDEGPGFKYSLQLATRI